MIDETDMVTGTITPRNEDGMVDNQLVVDKIMESKACLVMWSTENDLNINSPAV